MTEKTTFIPARIKSSVVGGHVAGASDIIDDAKGMTQDEVNASVDASIESLQGSVDNVDEKIDQAVNNLNNTISQNKQDADNKIAVIKGGSSKSIQNLSDEIATKQPTLTFDNAPELGSDNPVKSDGIKKALNEKQDNLEFENTPSDGSIKIVRSGGIKSYVDGKVLTEENRAKAAEQTLDSKIEEDKRNLQSEITRSTNKDTEHDSAISTLNSGLASEISRATGKENEIAQSVSQEEIRARVAEEANANGISGINAKIPSEASAQNQLADKAFVNSSIASNTSNYISNDGEPFNSYAELQAYSGQKTNNDYAFVRDTDASGNVVFKRYKYNAATNTWALEYELNNSSFTASQWSAINSGITAILTDKLTSLPSLAELTALLLLKQDIISDLDAIRENAQAGSEAYQLPQTGIPASDLSEDVRESLSKADTAIQEHQSLDDYYTKNQTNTLLLDKQSTINDLSDIREGAAKGATALQEHQSLADYYKKSETNTLLAEKQDKLTIDLTPTINSQNPICSDAVYDLQEHINTELAKKQNVLIYDEVPTTGSGNSITSGGVKAAINQVIADLKEVQFIYKEDGLPQPPSEDTLGAVYLVPDENNPNATKWFITAFSGTQYYWKDVNTISVDMTGYYDKYQVDNLFSQLATVASSGDFSDLANIPTTIAGYGIIDAKIENGVITLGSDTITPLTEHQDISGKAEKSEMSIIPGIDADADKTIVQLKEGLSATVLTQHQDISGKQDKLTFATDAECSSAANELT